MTALTTVAVRRLSVSADIGVHAHEIGRPQTLVLDVVLHLRPPASDDLAQTIDYVHITEVALDLAAKRTALIETFAQRLAEAFLTQRAVWKADVSVEKPGALAEGIASARVVLRRSRA